MSSKLLTALNGEKLKFSVSFFFLSTNKTSVSSVSAVMSNYCFFVFFVF